MVAALIATAVLTLGAAAAAGETLDPENELDRIDRTLHDSEARRDALSRDAERAAADIVSLKRRLVAAARNAREHEAQAGEIEQRLLGLEASEAVTSQSLTARRGQLAATLAALQRIARRPTAAMIAMPAGPIDTLRGALLMRAAVPELESRARALGDELRALVALRQRIAAERKRLAAAGETLARERKDLAALIAEKRALERAARRASQAEQERAARLAARARSMRELVHRLIVARGSLRRADLTPAPNGHDGMPDRGDAAIARLPSLLPASGRIVRRFGASGRDGTRSEGITIKTRPAANVVAPRRGTVVFAGPFRGYGRLLIIEHAEGYHVLLAGLDRIDAAVGDEVLAGEPVGAMTASSNGTPNLYLELRRSGRPINPLPWLAASRTKVSG